MEDNGLPDFEGKVVILYMANAPRGCEDGILMEYPHFVKRHERLFVSGRIPHVDGQTWVSNTQASVAWEAVIHYVEFKSIEEYRKRFNEYKPTFLERLRLIFG
ncbi:MAG: hypothetical protein A4E73_00898 [Syntrophaceae bacterium PtaU1.Bin231]|jgi:hypothetical protein|nr:MAG: hypothetical protein A4E73_00898 [Syntrophaceae bacterium PtaU1.Bin231]